MVQIHEEIEIDAPRETGWRKLVDLGEIQAWAAPIAESTCNGEPGPGAVRRCRFTDGGELEETITDWQEGEGFAYEIASEDPAFDGARSAWRVDEAGETTSVRYEMSVALPEEQAAEAHEELTQTARFMLEALKTNVETCKVLEPLHG